MPLCTAVPTLAVVDRVDIGPAVAAIATVAAGVVDTGLCSAGVLPERAVAAVTTVAAVTAHEPATADSVW